MHSNGDCFRRRSADRYRAEKEEMAAAQNHPATESKTDGAEAAAPCRDLLALGLLILQTHDKTAKATLTLQAEQLWKNQQLSLNLEQELMPPPDIPARPLDLTVVAPRNVPARGKGGSIGKRIALAHSLAHIESFAIDLSWDILYRFAKHPSNGGVLPREFFDDWVRIAAEEARHYSIWAKRLEQLGSCYGALPVHNGLWDSAQATSHDLLARLAVVHMVHEARGLDVTPQTIQRFRAAGDEESATLLGQIYKDEITHVASGVRWFQHVCRQRQPPLEPIPTFHELVRTCFFGSLKPPFNEQARNEAGFTSDWYLPLVKQKESSATDDGGEDHEVH